MDVGPRAMEEMGLKLAKSLGRLPDPAFWAQQRVLLTGHTGFKGSWTSLWLERLGATVHGFALAPGGIGSLGGGLRHLAHCGTTVTRLLAAAPAGLPTEPESPANRSA